MSASAVPPPLPARPRSRAWLALLLVPLGLVVGGFVLWGVFAGFDTEVEPGDRELMVTASRIAELYEGFEPDPAHETLSRTRYLDGSWDLSYAYEDPEGEELVYFDSMLSVETTRRDATAVLLGQWTALKAGLPLFAEDVDLKVVEADAVHWGDDARFASVVADGTPIGALFVARRQTRVFYALMIGLPVEGPADALELLEPALAKM